MTKDRPPKNAPAKAGVTARPTASGKSESIEQKRARRKLESERARIELEKFQAQYGKGYNALENFVYELDTFGSFESVSLSEEDEFRFQELMSHVERLGKIITSYLEHEFSSLDEAFQVRRPDGYRRPAERKKHLHMRKLQEDGCFLRKHGAKIGPEFFEFLATRHLVNKTTAAEWYYRKHRDLEPDPIKDKSAVHPEVRARLKWKR